MKTIEEKAKAYDEIIERAKTMLAAGEVMYGKENNARQLITDIIPELAESEDEKIRKWLIKTIHLIGVDKDICADQETMDKAIAWLENQKEPADKGEISDGYHTFNELYYYRMLYNAAFFNLLPKHLVHKSRRHHDGEECFGGGWFIVMAQLPTGQISNHYELKDWDLFQVPEQEKADEWDGHTPKEAAERIFRYLQLKQKPVVWSQEDERILAGIIGKIDHDQSYGVSKDDMLMLLKSIPSRILYDRNL